MSERIRVLRLEGTPYEVGFAHGKQWAETIRQISANNMKSIADLAYANGGIRITPDSIRKQLESYEPILRRHLPELHEETKGIADGAGMDFMDILALNGFLDLFDLTFPHLSDKILYSGGCSTFGVTAPDGAWSYMGQNYDVRKLFEPGVMLMDIRVKGRPRALVATVAGMTGCVGINEAGVAVAINNLTPRDSRPGILHQHMVRHILNQTRIGDAVNAVASLPRASGFNYLIGDASGEMIGLETSATEYDVYYPDPAGYICHCNHYVLPTMRHQEGTPASNGDSIARYGRMRHRLLRLDRSDPVESLKAACRDHTNYPYSICRHPDEDVPPPFGTGKTVFSVIMDLRRTELHICFGNPCKGTYERFSFS